MKSRVSGKALAGARQRPSPRKKAPGGSAGMDLRFRQLFETAKDGILILDANTHKILEVNPYLAGLLGKSRDEILGKELAELGILTDAEARGRTFAELEKQGTVRFEHELPGTTHPPVRVLEFVCNGYTEGGRLLIQCNIRDIAQRKESERKLREALQELALAKEELE